MSALNQVVGEAMTDQSTTSPRCTNDDARPFPPLPPPTSKRRLIGIRRRWHAIQLPSLRNQPPFLSSRPERRLLHMIIPAHFHAPTPRHDSQVLRGRSPGSGPRGRAALLGFPDVRRSHRGTVGRGRLHRHLCVEPGAFRADRSASPGRPGAAKRLGS